MTEHTLTKQDIRALKHADAIAFDHTGEGAGQIRAIVRAEHSSTGFEQTHTIAAFISTVSRHDGTDGDVRGFHIDLHAKYDASMRTIIRHMKEGGQFALHWVRGNSSPVTERAGVVRDELRIRIAPKSGAYTDEFLVAVFVGLDNSARMLTAAKSLSV